MQCKTSILIWCFLFYSICYSNHDSVSVNSANLISINKTNANENSSKDKTNISRTSDPQTAAQDTIDYKPKKLIGEKIVIGVGICAASLFVIVLIYSAIISSFSGHNSMNIM